MTITRKDRVWDKFWLISCLANDDLDEALNQRQSLSISQITRDRVSYADFLTSWHQSDDYLQVVCNVASDMVQAPEASPLDGPIYHAPLDARRVLGEARKIDDPERMCFERAITVASVIGELLWILRAHCENQVEICYSGLNTATSSSATRLHLPICKIFTEPHATVSEPWKNNQSDHFGWNALHRLIDWQNPEDFTKLHKKQDRADIKHALDTSAEGGVAGISFTWFPEFLDAVLGEIVISYLKCNEQPHEQWKIVQLLPQGIGAKSTGYGNAVSLLANDILPQYLSAKYSELPVGTRAFQLCCGLTGRPLGREEQTAAYFFILGILVPPTDKGGGLTEVASPIWDHLDSLKNPLLLHLANEQQRRLRVQLSELDHYYQLYTTLATQVGHITQTLAGLQGQVHMVENMISPSGDYWMSSYDKVEPLFNEDEDLKLHTLRNKIKVRHYPTYANPDIKAAGYPPFQGMYLFGHALRALLGMPDATTSDTEPPLLTPELASAYFWESYSLLQRAFDDRKAAAIAIGRLLTTQCDSIECAKSFDWSINLSSDESWQVARSKLDSWLSSAHTEYHDNIEVFWEFVDNRLCAPFKTDVRDFLKRTARDDCQLGSLFSYVPFEVQRDQASWNLTPVWKQWGLGNNVILVNFLLSFTGRGRRWKLESSIYENGSLKSVLALIDNSSQITPLHGTGDEKHRRALENTDLETQFKDLLLPFINGIRDTGAYISPNVGYGSGNVMSRYYRLAIEIASRAEIRASAKERLLIASSDRGELVVQVDVSGRVNIISNPLRRAYAD